MKYPNEPGYLLDLQLSTSAVALINHIGACVEAEILDPHSNKTYWKQRYSTVGRAVYGTRCAAARLDLTHGEQVPEASASAAATTAPVLPEASNDNAPQGDRESATPEPVWEKVLRTVRTRGGAEVVGEVRELPEGDFEAKVTFDGRTRVWDFESEWKAKNHVLVTARRLLDWAA